MRVAAAVVLAFALAGCRGPAEPEAVPTPVREEVERSVTVTITGARKHSITTRQPMLFLTRETSGDRISLSAAGIGPKTALTDGDTTVNPEIGIVGAYRGDGTYEVPAGTGSPVPTVGPKVTASPGGKGTYNVAVTFVTMKPKPRDQRFAYLLEPCTVTLRAKATEGTVTCPALVAANGDKISFAMTWGP